MWIYILLYILALNTSQATGRDNSTQMYYVKLMIEESAIGNITELLKPFVNDRNLHIDNVEKTTICQNVLGDTECTCEPNYKWSDEVCKYKEHCCGNRMCTFSDKSSHMCVSNSSVTVTGSIILKGDKFFECLAEQNSEPFKNCNNELLKNMAEVYSTLRGFDTLTINKYSAGSIIGEFEVTIALGISIQEFNNKTKELIKSLNASFVLETSGVVHLSMPPPNPVCYNTTYTFTCTATEDLGTEPEWKLKREGRVFKITNGTESLVTLGGRRTTISLNATSEHWTGEYSCIYKQEFASLTVSHKASAVMDVSLLPGIDISMSPSFPQCQGKELVAVTVRCEIERDSENYTVTWNQTSITAELQPQYPINPAKAAVNTYIRCGSSTTQPQLTCTYTNRCNQERNASITVNIINEGDKFCTAEGDWEATKGGHTAALKCKDEAGRRERKCSTTGTWEPEVSSCVNRKVKDALIKANIVDIGRGSLAENAANVFLLLQNVTNETETINSFPNINTSVEILHILSQKKQLVPNDTSANDFLESSSNLLEESLTQSWATTTSNSSLAEKYLIAVEQLVYMSNLSRSNYKNKNLEVAEQKCSQESKCNNTVFNVSIELKNSYPGSVKMIGFQELDKLLTNRDNNSEPNSIVVSTTTEKKTPDLKIKIKFQLLTPRRRNVQIQCVSWDTNNSSWSTDGCKWGGTKNEGQCDCEHLSSFAILMSKYPLEVPGLTAITYAGLSVSVASLIITLIIEVAVWSAVVRTNSLYLRHTAHINICLCLLVADCSFLASSKPESLSQIWCKTFVVLKHFCYLSMFFWMLCLSVTLLHQAVFLFHTVSKKTYLKLSVVLGYMCPLLIVSITVLTSVSTSASADAGAIAQNWYNNETCWLAYNGFMKGTIHAFVIPVGIIVFINIFSMLVVIMKLLDHPTSAETSHDKDKKAALTVMRTVVLLTPVFGVTWIFGFAMMVLDLTDGLIVYVIHYAFTLLNSFQGLLILLTTCLGDKPTREALMKRLKHRAPTSTTDSTTKLDSTSNK